MSQFMVLGRGLTRGIVGRCIPPCVGVRFVTCVSDSVLVHAFHSVLVGSLLQGAE